jgi:methyl-accepting chemotaxis protein
VLVSLWSHKRGLAKELGDQEEAFLSELEQLMGAEPPVLSEASSLFQKAFAILGKPWLALRAFLRGFVQGLPGLVSAMTKAGMKIDALAAASAQQNQSLQQVAAAVEELAASATEMAETASQAAREAEAARSEADESISAVEEALAAFSAIQNDMLEVRKEVAQLADVAKSIEEVVRFIADVSDQTRLLALNAKIEAARAGEAGKGFAVVADEVGKLSRRIQDGAYKVRESVTEITQRVMLAADMTQKLADGAAAAGQTINQAPAKLAIVQTHLTSITSYLENVAALTQDQAAGSQEAASGAQEVGNLAEAVAASTAELADDLVFLAERLEEFRQLLGNSDLPLSDEDMLGVAKSDHLAWIQRLHNLFWGRETLTTNEVTSSHECRFGRWYDGRGQEKFGSYATFPALAAPHERVHELAKLIVDAWYRGEKEEAQHLFAELSQLSSELVDQIEKLENEVRE